MGAQTIAKRDFYHDHVKRALIKDGWTITQDPFVLEIGERREEIVSWNPA